MTAAVAGGVDDALSYRAGFVRVRIVAALASGAAGPLTAAAAATRGRALLLALPCLLHAYAGIKKACRGEWSEGSVQRKQEAAVHSGLCQRCCN